MYYNVSVLFCEYENGIYSHLPFASPLTTSKDDAVKLFEHQLNQYAGGWRKSVNKLIYDKPIDTTSSSSIRQALVKVNEAAYVEGYYLLVLNEWNYNIEK